MCVECVSGQRNIITPMPIAMSPTVQALTAQRDDLLKALDELSVSCHDADKSGNLDGLDAAYVRARLAIAKATTGEQS